MDTHPELLRLPNSNVNILVAGKQQRQIPPGLKMKLEEIAADEAGHGREMLYEES